MFKGRSSAAILVIAGSASAQPFDVLVGQEIYEADRTPNELRLVGLANEGAPAQALIRDPSVFSAPTLAMRGNGTGLNGAVHVQTNIDAGGMNIVGDAGNEPSIYVDPRAPNRISVGWRQFDTILSSFRQGGFASSTDGGRTWSTLDRLAPGVFRSDPVLIPGDAGVALYSSLEVVANQFTCFTHRSNDGGATWDTGTFSFGGDKQWLAVDTTGGPGDGTIYQAWNTAGNSFFPNQFNRSFDNGVTWDAPVQYLPANGLSTLFPVFGTTTVGPDGAVYVVGNQNSGSTSVFWVTRSDQPWDPGGVQFDWGTQVDFGGVSRLGAGPNPAGLLGQSQILANHNPASPYFGEIYAMAPIDPPGADPMDVHFIRSLDRGETWSAAQRINDDPPTNTDDWQWMPTMGISPSGRLDIVWLDTRVDADPLALPFMNALFYSSSDDGGRTWSPGVQLSIPFDPHLGWPQQNKMGDYFDIVSDDVGAHLIWAATFEGEQNVYYTRLGSYDCNANGVPDETDISSGSSADCDADGIPDECELIAGDAPPCADCPADVNADGTASPADFTAWLGCFTDPASEVFCPRADVNADGATDPADFTAWLAAFASGCPGG